MSFCRQKDQNRRGSEFPGPQNGLAGAALFKRKLVYLAKLYNSVLKLLRLLCHRNRFGT